MATKKQPTTKAKPQRDIVVSNCAFTSTPAVGTMECAAMIAEAVIENAKALQAAAAMLKAPDSLLRIGN